MRMGSHQRRSPRHHSVHTTDPRYNVRQYGRGVHYAPGDIRLGLETRGGVTKTVHAWEVDDGLKTRKNYGYDDPDWRRAHNLTDSVGIDDPASAGERRGKHLPPKDELKPTDYIHETLRKMNPNFMTQYHLKNVEVEGDKLKLPIRRGGKQVDVTIKTDGDGFEVTAFDVKSNKVIYQEGDLGKKSLFDAINLAMKKAKAHKPEFILKNSKNNKVLSDVRALSSGTMATLTGEKKYKKIDVVQTKFADYIMKSDKTYENWQQAWDDFNIKKVAQVSGGWKRVKAQEDGNVSMWLENEKAGYVASIVPYGSPNTNDASIRVSYPGGRFEIPAHYSLIKEKSDAEIIDIVDRAIKRRG